MRFILIATLISIIVIVPVSVQQATHAQGEDGAVCTALTNAAIQQTNNFCLSLDRGFACYGNDAVDAEPRNNVINFQFESPGDVSNVTTFESIQLSGLDQNLEQWGVVFMKLRANIPQASSEAVSVLLFGSVSLENAGYAQEPVSVTLNKRFGLKLRDAPAYGGNIVYTGEIGEEMLAHEQNADGTWLYVKVTETDQMAWVRSSGVTSESDLTALPEYTGETLYQPMQAVYLSNNDSGDDTCGAFPIDGMLIQTPEGVAEVTLLINEVTIELGSTALVEVSPSRLMTFSLLEGHSSVTSNGVTVDVPARFSTTIQLGPNGEAISEPSFISIIDPAIMAMWGFGSDSLLENTNVLFDIRPEDNGPVTICHVPPGNPENAHAITVSGSALEAHLDHGDSVGECAVTGSPGRGRVNQNNGNGQGNSTQSTGQGNATSTGASTGQGQGQGEGQSQGQGEGQSQGQSEGQSQGQGEGQGQGQGQGSENGQGNGKKS